MLFGKIFAREGPVTEAEIEAAEKLRGKGHFKAALVKTKQLIERVEDGDMQVRLLFDVLYCSTRLGLEDETRHVIEELEKLPQPEMSRIIVDFIKAVSFIDLGHADKGLELIEVNLQSRLIEREDFRTWKYKHLAYKGRALTWLGRCEEALATLGSAHAMDPDGVRETAILIDQANCLLALDRYEEAYHVANQVLGRGDEEMKTLAMQYLAEIRVWQGRAQEALSLYSNLQRRLPCRLVPVERIRAGIRRAKYDIKEQDRVARLHEGEDSRKR